LGDWDPDGVRTIAFSVTIFEKMLLLEVVNGVNGIYQCVLHTCTPSESQPSQSNPAVDALRWYTAE
jgi:hypothetical protein